MTDHETRGDGAGRVLVAGATGYIGGLLAHRLAGDGRWDVRCMARDRSKAEDLERAGCEIVEADVLDPDSLEPALDGVDVAYYLVHSMGRGAEDDDFAERDRRGADDFAAAAKGIEVQIGGPEVTTYGGMMDDLAEAMGKRPPLKVTVPMLSPTLSSHWIGLVTPVDANVAKPLVQGLTTETVVVDSAPMGLFDVSPTPLDRAMRDALAEGQAA